MNVKEIKERIEKNYGTEYKFIQGKLLDDDYLKSDDELVLECKKHGLFSPKVSQVSYAACNPKPCFECYVERQKKLGKWINPKVKDNMIKTVEGSLLGKCNVEQVNDSQEDDDKHTRIVKAPANCQITGAFVDDKNYVNIQFNYKYSYPKSKDVSIDYDLFKAKIISEDNIREKFNNLKNLLCTLMQSDSPDLGRCQQLMFDIKDLEGQLKNK